MAFDCKHSPHSPPCFPRDGRHGFANSVHKRQTCPVPDTGMTHIIPHVGVQERTECRFVFLHVYTHVGVLLQVSNMQGRVNLSLCARQLAQGM